MDCIFIKDLEIYGNHGVLEEENALGQKFLVSCRLFLDLEAAGKTDDLDATVDYGAVCHHVKRFFTERTYKLLEKVARELALDLLKNLPVLERVEVTINKPWAPIGLPLQEVGVTLERGWHVAYVALGSNLGDRMGYLTEAVSKVDACDCCRVEALSEFVETAPYGVEDQPPFLNGCMKIRTLYRPQELLDFLQRLELEGNRVRERHWGPRTLDLDVLFYDDEVLDGPRLTVPHPDMENREFVLGPLSQIAPNHRHPLNGKTVAEMLRELKGQV